MTVEEEVIAAYQAAYDALYRAEQAPNDPALRRELETFWSGDQLAFVVRRLDERALAGQFLRPSPDTTDSSTVLSVTVSGDTAVLRTCRVDPWILVELIDGDERIVNDAVYVWVEEYGLVRSPSGWLVDAGLSVDDLSESGTCPAQ